MNHMKALDLHVKAAAHHRGIAESDNPTKYDAQSTLADAATMAANSATMTLDDGSDDYQPLHHCAVAASVYNHQAEETTGDMRLNAHTMCSEMHIAAAAFHHVKSLNGNLLF